VSRPQALGWSATRAAKRRTRTFPSCQPAPPQKERVDQAIHLATGILGVVSEPPVGLRSPGGKHFIVLSVGAENMLITPHCERQPTALLTQFHQGVFRRTQRSPADHSTHTALASMQAAGLHVCMYLMHDLKYEATAQQTAEEICVRMHDHTHTHTHTYTLTRTHTHTHKHTHTQTHSGARAQSV